MTSKSDEKANTNNSTKQESYLKDCGEEYRLRQLWRGPPGNERENKKEVNDKNRSTQA